jgi:Family of unknown function (DUF5941)
MSVLATQRDDGPLVRRAAALLSRPAEAGPFAWLLPPAVRAAEYGGLIALTMLTDPDALLACFGFLAAIAFHQYDVLYRLRAGREVPPAWIAAIGGGWEVRLLVAAVLAAVDVLEPAFLVAAIGLGAVYVTESAAAWLRDAREGVSGTAENADPEALE